MRLTAQRLSLASSSFTAFITFSALFLFISRAGAIIGTSSQMQLGNPSGATADSTNHEHYLIQRTVEAMDYNDDLGEPNWASWDLTSSDVGTNSRSSFHTDTTLPSGFYEVTSDDYTNSGYDRGHMCPSDDRTDTTNDNWLVFYMSNIVPQQDDLNTGPWEALETYCRTLASASNDELLVTCGPSGFEGSYIQPSGKVAIPDYTWKIAVVVPPGNGSALSRITSTTRVITVKMPNLAGIHSVNWTNYITSVNRIQADTGYTFFSALSPSIAAALRAEVDGGVDHYPPLGKVVISQIYGGGGNSGATYKNDFIELYNSGSASVDLSAYAVQYASASGSTWSETALGGSIAAGDYYLVQEAAGSGGASNLPTPDAVGTINLSATAGKVALTSSTALLSGADPLGGSTVVDFVGYGTTASAYEGSGPAPAPSSTTSDLRADGGAQDTDDNAADFATGGVNPRNSDSGGSSGSVVISQVYGGGGNSGATYKNDFVELYNNGASSVDLSAYAVQYAGATSSSWSETLLTGSVAPGHYYLIQEAAGSGGTQSLPTPEATGTISMAATAGKVALTRTQTLLAVDDPVGNSNVVDFVGYGATADAYEGSGPAPAPSNTTADLRANGGAMDTNDNAADFATGAPDPRN
ncbi:MAG TPA: DNA/RNA non-specific endonuclease [Verrucomicrobiae bacterium]|nr:DNA/RNA non-specific endonuclease [Verrucomicrobiae bacterium]